MVRNYAAKQQISEILDALQRMIQTITSHIVHYGHL